MSWHGSMAVLGPAWPCRAGGRQHAEKSSTRPLAGLPVCSGGGEKAVRAVWCLSSKGENYCQPVTVIFSFVGYLSYPRRLEELQWVQLIVNSVGLSELAEMELDPV